MSMSSVRSSRRGRSMPTASAANRWRHWGGAGGGGGGWGKGGRRPACGGVAGCGRVAYASSLDRMGPSGQCVRDVALLLEGIAGQDRRDSTSVDQPVPPYAQTVDQPVQSL